VNNSLVIAVESAPQSTCCAFQELNLKVRCAATCHLDRLPRADKAYFRWQHYNKPLSNGMRNLPYETDACASVTAAFLQVLADWHHVATPWHATLSCACACCSGAQHAAAGGDFKETAT
jgi:hypothetical protein